MSAFPDLSESIWPTRDCAITKETFLQWISGDDTQNCVNALTELSLLDPFSAVEWLIAATQAIDGLKYARLVCIFKLLDDRSLKYPTELTVLRILYLNADHNINFHELMKAPRDVLLSSITSKNVLSLSPLASVIGIPSDDLFLHYLLKVSTSRRFEDHAPFIAALRHPNSLEPLVAHLPQKLIAIDQPRFYQSVGLLAEKRRQKTINDLNAHGLREFITDAYLDSPAKLICELYSRMCLQESLGSCLHELARRIAEHFELAINKIREYLVNLWLCEIETKAVEEHPSVFCETLEEAIQKDENVNIQKSIFMLKAWKKRTACKWLLRFIYQSGSVTSRAKAKAFTCLFAIADESEIASAFTRSFEELLELHRQLYFASRLALVGIDSSLQDFADIHLPASVSTLLSLHHGHPGACRVLLEIVLSCQIDDRSLLLRILKILLTARKRFLLQIICSIFTVFRRYATDSEFIELYKRILSAPLEELIAKGEFTRPFKAHHLSVLRELLDAVAAEPVVLDNWVFHGHEISWDEMVQQLCVAGFAAFGAELGAMAVDPETRRSILSNLMREGHFDEALKFGFDRESVFRSIVRDHLEQATQVLIDDHLELFSDWLSKCNDTKSIDAVARVLRDQGRTVEAKRISEKLCRN
jgi:hypothetical protein